MLVIFGGAGPLHGSAIIREVGIKTMIVPPAPGVLCAMGCVVAVTHDRYFLDNVAGWILELDRGHGIPYEGNYSSWLEQKQKRLEQEARQEGSRQKQLATELDWIRQNPKGRQAKSKARVRAYDDLVAEAAKAVPDSTKIVIPIAERLGNEVITAEGLTKAYGDKLLFENLDDAERYAGLLEAQDFPVPTVESLDREEGELGDARVRERI